MVNIKAEADISMLENGNEIQGAFPVLKDSEIQFFGKNNILYCEPGVTLNGSIINFAANNSVVFLRRNRHEYKLSVSVHNDCVFYMGENTYINEKMTVILSEQRHCLIGDNCIISWGVCIRNSDPHLIYDCDSKKRRNPSRSVYIGDHVWLGQNSLILKGSEIDSGSIIGANAVISGKKVPHNTSWVGNPARQVAENIFWDRDCVHRWTKKDTKLSMDYGDYIEERHADYNIDDWIFTYVKEEEVRFSDVDKSLIKAKGSNAKYAYLKELMDTSTKNRFVHEHQVNNKKKKRSLFRRK